MYGTVKTDELIKTQQNPGLLLNSEFGLFTYHAPCKLTDKNLPIENTLAQHI